MTEEEAYRAYLDALTLLNEVVASGHLGNVEDIVAKVESDLD